MFTVSFGASGDTVTGICTVCVPEPDDATVVLAGLTPMAERFRVGCVPKPVPMIVAVKLVPAVHTDGETMVTTAAGAVMVNFL